ncbi:hypothetical protein QWZ08_04700 [Ferruginibacter paludis]|uniref:hypothetical protein n=1 Tax=Ferruginibacter TaxID=1004303 RepID=UPI0025B3BE58|nr:MULTISPECIES: hypothetical protein [Ferruginibacter]MDB5277605.1 hypothetical protein [Ferruginibacter sp.]MDN3654916.1 hypothetical protein [Ferruginibacter paludis]
MTSIEIVKQKIINIVMGMDNEAALQVLHDVVIKFNNPSSVVEDELTDEEWNEIEDDMKEIEAEELKRQEEVVEHLKQWKSGK